MFSPSGGKLQSFGTGGSGQGQFNGPSGVAVDSGRYWQSSHSEVYS